MNLPTDIVSKIMLYHESVPFDKDEFLDFMQDWNYVKDCVEKPNLDDDEWTMLELIMRSNKMFRKYYHKHTQRERYLFGFSSYRIEHLYDEYRLWDKP